MNPKTEIYKIGLSKTFPMRARCRKCGSLPVFYYNTCGRMLLKQPLVARSISAPYRGNIDIYPQDTRLSDFSYHFAISKFSTRYHKNTKKRKRYNMVEYVTCQCCLTKWAFNDLEFIGKPESYNRKSDRTYPMEF